MADVLTKKQRSYAMSKIRGKDTKPELVLRKRLHALGFRYRLHSADLPGKPDLVLRRYGATCFVNGCFWHRHPNCRYATTPATRQAFWRHKFEANVARDKKNQRELMSKGWRVAIVWECQLRGAAVESTVSQLADWLSRGSVFDGSRCWSPKEGTVPTTRPPKA